MMPDFLSPDVKEFILRLLIKEPRNRLGGGPLDAEEVKRHKFFNLINWDDLLKRNIPAPFIPRIHSLTDVSNFSEEFTSMPAVDTPSVVPPNVEEVFSGYSFVAPSVLFAENNVISEELFRPNPDKKPSTSNLVGCKLTVNLSSKLIEPNTLRSLINVQCTLIKFPKKYRPVRSY